MTVQSPERAGNTPANIQRIPLEAISQDKTLWPRARLYPERVADFARLLHDEGEEALPPVVLAPYPGRPGRWAIIDGWHRIAAHEAAGFTHVRAVIRQDIKTAADIYTEAVRSGALSAMPLTRAERLAAVARILKEHPDWADRQIARLCGVSHTYVQNVRHPERAEALREKRQAADNGDSRAPYAPMYTAEDIARGGELLAWIKGGAAPDARRGRQFVRAARVAIAGKNAANKPLGAYSDALRTGLKVGAALHAERGGKPQERAALASDAAWLHLFTRALLITCTHPQAEAARLLAGLEREWEGATSASMTAEGLRPTRKNTQEAAQAGQPTQAAKPAQGTQPAQAAQSGQPAKPAPAPDKK